MPINPLPIERSSSKIGIANIAFTHSTDEVLDGDVKTLIAVYIAYSANVTQNVTVTINSALGSAWDILLNTMALSTNRYGVYIPDKDVPLYPGDTIDVLMPAGGSSITGTVQVMFANKVSVQDGEGGYQIEPQMGAR